jgi:hypothetical protein
MGAPKNLGLREPKYGKNRAEFLQAAELVTIGAIRQKQFLITRAIAVGWESDWRFAVQSAAAFRGLFMMFQTGPRFAWIPARS